MRIVYATILHLLATVCFCASHTVPFTVMNGLIVVDGSIGDKQGKFILDSGSSGVLLHCTKVKTEKGEWFETLGGPLKAYPLQKQAINLGGYSRIVQEAFTADLSAVQSYLGVELAGIMGSQIFAPHAFTIDYANKVLTVSTEPQGSDYDYSQSLDFEMMDGVPVCELSIGDRIYWFVLDSGASSHHIDVQICLADPQSYSLTSHVTTTTTATGETDMKQTVQLHHLELGSQTMDSVRAIVTDFSHFEGATSKPIAGILSLQALGVDRIFVDVDNQQISF